ncbi:MAG: thioredoxin family protein [Verrucomicrobiota bacterium]|nr:thioredoxin family protein [Verrucomicrobiota bacterium]
MKTKLVTAVLTTIVASAAFATESPRVGAPAPDFSASDSKGKTRSLSEFKGKYVVLEWFNPECPFVKKHYGSGNMQKLQKEAADHGVVWLTIDSSAPGQEGNLTPDAASKAMTDLKMNSTALLLDADGKAGQTYGAKNTPHMFVINPAGQLIYQGAIDDKPTANPADVATANNYVRAAITDAMANRPVANPTTKPYGCSVKY